MALTHLAKGDTFYSQAAHALFGNRRSFILLQLLGWGGEVGLKLGSMQKILEDNANSRRKKQGVGGEVGDGRGPPGPVKE